MKRIFRYVLDVTRPTDVPIGPLDRVVMAAFQPNRMDSSKVGIWVEHLGDPELTEKRTIMVVGTGREIPNDWKWLASSVAGPFVWHIYEVPA